MKLNSLWAVALPRLVRRLSRWAWRNELETLARIDEAQKNPPRGKVKMYIAGWRDRNAIGWGDHYIEGIYPTPDDAKATIDALRKKHGWSDGRSSSCGQRVDVFFPVNA